MSQVLEDLKQIVSSSNISPGEQNDLLVFLPILPKNLINDLCKIFQKDPEKLKSFNSHFKAKIKALTGKSDEEWDEIIKKEAEEAGELPIEEKEIEEGEVPGPNKLEPEE